LAAAESYQNQNKNFHRMNCNYSHLVVAGHIHQPKQLLDSVDGELEFETSAYDDCIDVDFCYYWYLRLEDEENDHYYYEEELHQLK